MDLIGEAAADSGGDATHLKAIAGEMRRHGFRCVSGLCRFVAGPPCGNVERGRAHRLRKRLNKSNEIN